MQEHPRTYIIAFTFRSGSNLLCEYLTAAGLGAPTEYFQYPLGVANRYWYELCSVAPDDHRTFVRELVARRSRGGLFGTKITWDQKSALIQALHSEGTDEPSLDDVLPNAHWIHLRRRDYLGQAISLWRAIKTGQWVSNTPLAPGQSEPEYDFLGIYIRLANLMIEDMLWEEYFVRCAITPLTIWYEDLARDPTPILAQIDRLLETNALSTQGAVEATRSPSLGVQRNVRSQQMREQLLADLSHIGATSYWGQRAPQLRRWAAFFEGEQWRNE
jgi:LPS sulfotransferase NodH